MTPFTPAGTTRIAMQTELPLQRIRAQHVDAVAVVVFSTVGSWWLSSSFKLVLEGNASGEEASRQLSLHDQNSRNKRSWQEARTPQLR